MNDRISDFINSFRPVKLKTKELVCWHIEREEPPTHAFPHCHEYGFSGEMSITPKNKSIPIEITEFYLGLPTGRGVIKANCISSPLDSAFGIPPNNNIIAPFQRVAGSFIFQIRIEEEIIIPPKAYVIIEFKRGKVKSKVVVKVDDEYRPSPSYLRRCG